MKKIALFFSLFVYVVACFAQNCTINGRMNVPAFQNKEVRLLNDVTWETIATTTINDSAFTFTVPASEPHWAMITTVTASGSNNYFLDVIVEPGIITCDLVTDELAGTPNNDIYGKFHQDIQKEMSIYHSLPAKFENIQNMSEQEIEQLKAETMGQKKKISDMALQAFIENKDNLVGVKAFDYLEQMNKVEYKELKNLLADAAPVVQNYPDIVRKMEKLERLEQTSEGKPYVDVDVKEFKTGKTVKLSKYIKGKVALIDFWASWCGPCRKQIPNIAKIYEKYGKDIVVVSLNVWDQPEERTKAIKEMRMNWVQLMDDTRNATNMYGISGIPQIMLIGKDGTILARDLFNDEIEEAVQNALK